MESQQDSATSQPIKLTLEVVPEDPLNSDPALVDAVGRDTADALRSEGYTVQPVYTDTRGGPLVEIITFLAQVAANAWANKEALIADVSGLVTILTAAATVVSKARQAYEKRVGKDTAQQYPISFTLDIDGMSIPFAVSDVENAEDIFKMAQRLQTSHPALAHSDPSQSKAGVKASVPKQPHRKRR
ncbi:MAG TPA: hypothetical protein VIX20_16085 [Ktedonobacteraceae bacterium]